MVGLNIDGFEYWWAQAGGRRVAVRAEEESLDQLRPVAAAPPLPALLLSRGRGAAMATSVRGGMLALSS